MPAQPRKPADIVAAGAVVTRKDGQVLLVHRPKYDDWSFPKGKLDPGEHVTTAAVREVAEETGLDIRLGPPLTTQRYLVGNGQPKAKDVHYWTGRVVLDDDVSGYQANDEVDEVSWLPVDEARARLTYDYDRATLREAEQLPRKSLPLVVLRHGRALPRRSFHGDDRERPLGDVGLLQSELVVPVLGAYGVRRVVSSSSRRCWSTVSPYADVADLDVEVTDDLSEEDAEGPVVADLVHELLLRKEAAVLCTHRQVLPLVLDAVGVPQATLSPGALLVVHHRHGAVVATEHHEPETA